MNRPADPPSGDDLEREWAREGACAALETVRSYWVPTSAEGSMAPRRLAGVMALLVAPGGPGAQ